MRASYVSIEENADYIFQKEIFPPKMAGYQKKKQRPLCSGERNVTFKLQMKKWFIIQGYLRCLFLFLFVILIVLELIQ